MTNGLLLWVDDEIELLKAHLLFLEKKGYEVMTVTNGSDAIDLCKQHNFDLAAPHQGTAACPPCGHGDEE